ncbi:prosaposin a preproprotein [Echinococcus multilocularis]|uniref:Prosaposin a preproprotein n=1 Tax=Echinococcus multilocularis TaxID=6211 RepID=A0A068Y936_ECHMU|nr:prosaposin a preproprotein [Echinococcus multilocularis]
MVWVCRIQHRMGLVGLCILLCVLCTALGEKPNVKDAAEGVICRSYASAKENGMLDVCKNLWLHATLVQPNIGSNECRDCERLVTNGAYSTILSKVSKPKGSLKIGDVELKQLASELTLKFDVKSTCNDCKKIITDLRALVQDNDTKSAIASYLKKAFCYELPLQVVDICKHTVDAYVVILMDMAGSELHPGPICALFGLCPTERIEMKKSEKDSEFKSHSWIQRPAPVGFEFFHSRLSYSGAVSDLDGCTECKNVFSRIRDQTKDPVFDQALKNVVKESLCESFGYFKSMCEAAVSKEVDSMIDNASKMNITDLCFFFNQCTENVSPVARAFKASLFRLFAPPSQELNVPIPFVCPVCEMFFAKVIDLVLNNRSEAAIVWALEESCNLLPSKSREACIRFVEAYSDVIIREILAGTAPKIICSSFGACDAVAAIPVAPGDSECKLCELIVGRIYENLENNATKEDIVKALETACSHLPYLRARCVQLVDEYCSQVVDLFVSGVPPKEACQKIGFCSEVVVAEPSLKDVCSICEVVFADLYSKLLDNATVERIEGLLEYLCKYVPSAYTYTCQSWVEQNTAAIIDLVVQKLPPREICEDLSICYHSVPSGSPIGTKCEICKEIVDFIYTRIQEDATADQIEKALESVCDYLPNEGLKSTCHEYVKAYTQILIDLLVKHLPSKEVCQELRLCPSDALLKHLCAGGPSAWCRDEYTAKLCSQETFCKEFIWQLPNPSNPNSRPPVVRKYDCSKLSTREERCSDERLMRLCGFGAFCLGYKRPPVDPSNACRFCRNLLTQRLTYGSFALDCSIYVNPLEKTRCQNVRSLKIPGRMSFNNLDSICKENQLCDDSVESPPMNSLPPLRKLTGDDPCLWGPSVACRDADIAARCGVTTYCQQHVWLADQPQFRAEKVPSLALIDCSRPLREICVSPLLRYCGRSILEQCRLYAASDSVGSDMRREMCKDRPLSFCSDPRMVKLCGMGEYCEAMSMTPTSPAPLTTEAPRDPRCRLGSAFVCQTYANAVLCDQVEMCRSRFWPRGV